MRGRLTLGLYNCYDPKQWHDIMRVTLARVGPVALAFDADVVTFGFPFLQARGRAALRTQALRTHHEIADFIATSTSIGEGGDDFRKLVELGRFDAYPFEEPPGKLGRLVATTPQPDAPKATTPLDVAARMRQGEAHLLLFGLGPRGLPADVLAASLSHLEITGKGISMETATALGALPAMIHAHLMHM